MGKRILVAVIFIPLLLVLIYGIAPAYPWALCLLIAGLSMISVHEVLWSTGFLKHARISGYSIVLAGLIPFWVYYDGESLPALCGLFVYVVLLFAEAIAAHKRISLEKLGGAFFLSIVIPFFLSSFLRIRQMEHWQYLILLPLEAAFLSDAFALFAGMAFGKHKLAPKMSPNKTWEGSIGGTVATVILVGIYLFFFPLKKYSLPVMLLITLVLSVAGQIGDLVESAFKRHYGVKDSGKILPGHGGILDRFDSLLFVLPLMHLFGLI